MEEKMKRRPTEPRMRTVVRLLALLCKRIDRLEEQLRAIEMLIIYGRRTCPNAPMIDGYCVSKCDSSITFSTRAPFLRFAALQFSFPGPQCPSGDFPARVGSGWGAPHENRLSKVVEQAR